MKEKYFINNVKITAFFFKSTLNKENNACVLYLKMFPRPFGEIEFSLRQPTTLERLIRLTGPIVRPADVIGSSVHVRVSSRIRDTAVNARDAYFRQNVGTFSGDEK